MRASGNERAVDRDERAAIARAAFVDCARHQLLACALIADNQDRFEGCARRFDARVEPAHNRAAAYQSVKTGAGIMAEPRGLAFKRRDSFPGGSGIRTKVGADQKYDAHMAELVEAGIDFGGRVLGKNGLSAFFEQMQRGDDLLQRHAALGQEFAQMDHLRGVEVHVRIEQRLLLRRRPGSKMRMNSASDKLRASPKCRT